MSGKCLKAVPQWINDAGLVVGSISLFEEASIAIDSVIVENFGAESAS
jgi:hypothetical protein